MVLVGEVDVRDDEMLKPRPKSVLDNVIDIEVRIFNILELVVAKRLGVEVAEDIDVNVVVAMLACCVEVRGIMGVETEGTCEEEGKFGTKV